MIQEAPISMIMTEHVITLSKKDSLEKAEQLFKHYKIRHIPVTDRKRVVGMLSYSDLLRLSFADVTNEADIPADVMVYNMFKVEQVMKRNVISVPVASSIKEVAEILAIREFHALPVVNRSILVGIVTTTDLIKYLLQQF